MEKTDLSREEQWTFLNAPAVITTLGKIQDLQLNRTAYGLSAAQIERTSDELMLLANARLEANGADSPFRETKAKQRFLRMLDMREEEVMKSVLHGGKEQLTGYEKLRYDEQKTGNVESVTQHDEISASGPRPIPVHGHFRFPRADNGQMAYIFYTKNEIGDFYEQAVYQEALLKKRGILQNLFVQMALRISRPSGKTWNQTPLLRSF